MRALSSAELNFVAGGFDEGSQLLGPTQTSPGFGGADWNGGGFGSGGNGLGGTDLGWFECNAECQQRKAEEERRKREHREKMEQLKNNRMDACLKAGGSWRAGTWVSGFTAFLRGVDISGAYIGESCIR